MKRSLCLLLALAAVLMCGCSALSRTPTTLADETDIPDDGMVPASVFEALSEQNEVCRFKGRSGSIEYFWTVFGRDIKDAKELCLGLEITESDDEKIEIEFLSETDFGFTPVLSIYLNRIWHSDSADAVSDTGEVQRVSVTGKTQSILNFSPLSQKGVYTVTPVYADRDETSEAEIGIKPQPEETTASEASAETKPEAVDVIVQSSGTVGGAAETTVALNESEAVADSDETKRPVSDGKDSGQDQFKTDPVPEGKPLPVELDSESVNDEVTYTCIFSIECSTILNNIEMLEADKLDVLPSNGVIFAEKTVTFYEGESVYDVLQRICKENGIHMEASWTPIYNSAYVEGIGNLYEFDCGSGSGWMYCVDGWYPNYGCSRYMLCGGERVEWRYTCDLGSDIDGGYAVGD